MRIVRDKTAHIRGLKIRDHALAELLEFRFIPVLDDKGTAAIKSREDRLACAAQEKRIKLTFKRPLRVYRADIAFRIQETAEKICSGRIGDNGQFSERLTFCFG